MPRGEFFSRRKGRRSDAELHQRLLDNPEAEAGINHARQTRLRALGLTEQELAKLDGKSLLR